MLEEINAYIQSVLPAKLPASKRQALYDELFSHISDRYEFYREIGFDDEQSTKKAIHDMGEDEKTTEYMRNEFDELYFEKTWWAVLAFFGVLGLNAAAGLLGISVVSPTTTATPSAWKVGVSFLFLLCNIIVIRTIYRFGCRKSLLAFSAGYLLIAVIFSGYSLQAACYSLSLLLYCLFDRFTPLVLRFFAANFFAENFSEIIASFVFLLFSIISFCLSRKIAHRGKPKTKLFTRKIICAGVAFLVVAGLSVSLFQPALMYMRNYPIWFNETTDTISEDSAEIYNKLCSMQTYDAAKNYLQQNGYVQTTEYVTTLPKNEAKKFTYSLEKIPFCLEENYEIYFKPDPVQINLISMREPSNGFIYLLPASDGKIASVGVGNAMEIFYHNTGTVKTDEFIMDTKACLAAFENIKAGDSQEKILTQYAEKFGYKYTEFKTFTPEGEKEYYRFVCDRNYINYDDATKVPLYVELYFENGVLTDGRINYLKKSGFSLIPQEIPLQK